MKYWHWYIIGIVLSATLPLLFVTARGTGFILAAYITFGGIATAMYYLVIVRPRKKLESKV